MSELEGSISRQDAIDALATYIHHVDRAIGTGKLSDQQCVESAHSIIDELPSAERKGKWISYIDDGFVECPFCGSLTNCDSKEEMETLHYCFNCGSRNEVSE